MLSRVGVRSVMIGRFSLCPAELSQQKAQALLRSKPQWLVIHSNENTLLMAAADLSRYLEDNAQCRSEADGHQLIKLLQIPAKRLNASIIDQSSNLYQARKYLQGIDTEALLICRQQKQQKQIIGIITADIINNHYS